ncbi:cytochrome C [Brevundimonas sp. FT23042]|uniref:cytochrome C n=1 Tax=Brevundimonas sp. FT23042 TaxID=3393749 RepID=UPI003B588D82
MIVRHLVLLGAFAVGLGSCQQPEVKISAATDQPHVAAASDIEVGRYLVLVSGCNDCHTAGYAVGDGRTPEADWLKGAAEGFYGPWGTSYPQNLRRTVAGMSEDDWVEMLNTRAGLPPMPWPSVRAMAETDKRALYRYIKSLPFDGDPAPAALPPGQVPTTAWVDMTPKGPGA